MRCNRRAHLPVVAFSLVLVAAIGLIDYLTGYESRLFLLYFIPVGIASWVAGRAYGLFAAIASALAWTTADILSGHAYPLTAHLFWNCGIQLVTFVFAAVTLSRISADLETQKQLNAELSKAISRADELNAELQAEKARIESLNNAIMRDLDTARIVQRTMIPQSVPRISGLDIAIEYRPTIQVGGDVLDALWWFRHGVGPVHRGRSDCFGSSASVL